MLNKINKIKIISVAILSILSVHSQAQAIVNIEDLRLEGEIGFFTNIAVSLDAARGNRDRDNYSLQLRFDNNSEDFESFAIFQQSERKSNEVTTDESTFMHGRYILLGQERLHWEIFAQYSENPFENYKKRSVFGTGIRYEITNTMRLGSGFLNEDETDLSGKSNKTDRLGFYLHNAYEIVENISFNPTIYFQPSLNNFENDYKTSMILAIDFKVNENFKIMLQYSSAYDSDPPMLAEKSDESISTMFSYDMSQIWMD